MSSIENKKSYFCLRFNLSDSLKNSSSFNSELDDAVDYILHSMGAPVSETYYIEDESKLARYYVFRTNDRKRQGQLNKFCKRYINPNWDLTYQTNGLRADEVPQLLNRFKEEENYNFITREQDQYNGRDIQVFKNHSNWHPWQLDIYKMLFKKQNNFKDITVPDDRSIISLIDFKGNSGKSSFWKYLYSNNQQDIGRLTYGTASQLKSSVVNLGVKKIYIIDLARTTGSYDSETDLMSVVEDIKSGLVISPLYGSGKQLLMEPPHIIISGNYLFQNNLLSQDRWKIYEIKNNRLGALNKLLKVQKRKESIKK